MEMLKKSSSRNWLIFVLRHSQSTNCSQLPRCWILVPRNNRFLLFLPFNFRLVENKTEFQTIKFFKMHQKIELKSNTTVVNLRVLNIDLEKAFGNFKKWFFLVEYATFAHKRYLFLIKYLSEKIHQVWSIIE